MCMKIYLHMTNIYYIYIYIYMCILLIYCNTGKSSRQYFISILNIAYRKPYYMYIYTSYGICRYIISYVI